jgi:hypothetical protein
MRPAWAWLGACLALLAGCSIMTPARYSVSMDNNLALKKYAGSRVRVASMTAVRDVSEGCRLTGPIRTPDNTTIPEFIEKAFNDELKFAGLYADNGVSLFGRLDRISFSSGFVNGWWDLALTLSSSNGRSLSVENRYGFKTGADSTIACNQTAQALGAAVQDLILKVATHPRFSALLR